MKKIVILLFIVYMQTNIAFAQAASHEEYSRITQTNDSLTSDKGDLKLLVERVYLAFKAYRTGMHEFDKMESDSMRAIRAARNDSLQKAGWLINHYIIQEKPIYPAIVRGENHVYNIAYHFDLNKIPADSVMSIEITNYPTRFSVLNGASGKGMVIRLKE